MPTELKAASGDQAEGRNGFAGAAEMAEMLEGVEIASATGENTEMNRTIAARRESEAAQERLDVHVAVGKQVEIAKALLGNREGAGLPFEAQDYLDAGGTLDQLMGELAGYMEEGAKTSRERVHAVDKNLADSRKNMVAETLRSKGVLHRAERTEAKEETERQYLEAFAAKIHQLSAIPKGDREEALRAGYLPEMVESMSFDSEGLSLEELAGHQLHVLTDMLCREQLMRQELVEQVSHKGAKKLLRKLRDSKLVRGTVAAGVVAATAVTIAHGVPASHVVEQGLGTLAAYITSKNILEGGTKTIESFAGRRQRKADRKELAGDGQLADLTLKTAYNEIEQIPGDRKGTEDEAENLRRFEAIAPDYVDLRTAPGGKPYSAEMMLDYCSRLYLQHKEELDLLVLKPDAEDRREAYHELAELILRKDVLDMKRQVGRGRARKTIFMGVSVLSAAIASQVLSNIDTGKSVSGSILAKRSSAPI